MVVISFSVIMSCERISLLLVTVGIMYSRIGRIGTRNSVPFIESYVPLRCSPQPITKETDAA